MNIPDQAAVVESRRPADAILVISGVEGGGSFRYVRDLERFFQKVGVPFVYLSHLNDLTQSSVRNGQTLILQQLINTPFSLSDVNEYIERYQLKCIIPVHDNYFCSGYARVNVYDPMVNNPTQCENYVLDPEQARLLQNASRLIFPSQYIHDFFLQVCQGMPRLREKCVITDHIDFCVVTAPPMRKDETHDRCIRLATITEVSVYKGVNILRDMMTHCQCFSSDCMYRIEYHLFGAISATLRDDIKRAFPHHVVIHGAYQEGNVLSLLTQHRIHGLVFANQWPETYSYAFTKGLMSHLPILYSPLGAIAERVSRLSSSSHTHAFVPLDASQINASVTRFCQIIVDNDRQILLCDEGWEHNTSMSVPQFYADWASGFHS